MCKMADSKTLEKIGAGCDNTDPNERTQINQRSQSTQINLPYQPKPPNPT